MAIVAALLWPAACRAQEADVPPVAKPGAEPQTAAPPAESGEQAEPAVQGGAELDYVSRYVWRGLPLSRGMVQQSSVWVTAGELTFTAWNNLVLGREENRHRINEVDLSVGASHAFGPLTVEPSLLYYTYPHQAGVPSTGELSVKVSHEAGSITLYTAQTFDVVRYHGAYYGEAGASRHWDAPHGAGIDAGASVSWASRRFNEAYAGVNRAAFNVGTLSLAGTIPAGRYSVRPHVAWTAFLNRDLRRAVSPSRMLVFGLAIDREFP